MPKQILELRKIREFGDIISDTFVFIKQNFKPLMKAFFVLCGMFILAGIIASVYTQTEINDVTANFYNNDYRTQSSRFTSSFFLGYAVIFLFLWLNFTAFYVTVLSFVALYQVKGKVAPSLEEVWSYFKHYYFKVLFSNLVIGAFMVVCFSLCFVPGIYVFPAMTIFFPILILEDVRFGYAFDRSFKLLKDQWWSTAGVLLIIYIITYACSSIIQFPAVMLMMIAKLTHAEKPINNGYLYATAIAQNLSQVFYIIPAVASALVYYNLVERKECTGLFERIENLGKQKQDDILPEQY